MATHTHTRWQRERASAASSHAPPAKGFRGGGEGAQGAASAAPRRACVRQDVVIETRDGLTRPFAKGHGNAQSAGSVQDPALRLNKLDPHLRVVDFLEEHAGMKVEDIKAARDGADLR